MSDVEALLLARLGKVQYWALRKALRALQIHLDADSGELVIYRGGTEPFSVSFESIEDFVNNICQG
jgi:hypothetical protein